MEYIEKFRKRLRELRLEKQLSVNQLAKEVGFSGAAISRWENGLQIPKFIDVVVLADFFNVSMDYLTGRLDY